jgi:hypothetical protein
LCSNGFDLVQLESLLLPSVSMIIPSFVYPVLL